MCEKDKSQPLITSGKCDPDQSSASMKGITPEPCDSTQVVFADTMQLTDAQILAPREFSEPMTWRTVVLEPPQMAADFCAEDEKRCKNANLGNSE